MQNVNLRKVSKNKLKRLESKTISLKFGNIGLKSLESGVINVKQLESVKKTIVQTTSNKAKVWLRVSNFIPVFTKSIGARMGKGKGKFSHFVLNIKAGEILFEISGCNHKLLIKSLNSVKKKLPIETKISFK